LEDAVPQPPNILIIWGDDIGISNLSCYSDGLMGYRTPNIDRIAAEGVRFTDYYGEQSCTAGRAAFISGQNPYRTGLTKVGMPGADIGLRREDPTIATALKAHGYATGQFGKNHLGDRDEFLPTAHGFDEFFGNLYHLNAEEEPELEDYPTDTEWPDAGMTPFRNEKNSNWEGAYRVPAMVRWPGRIPAGVVLNGIVSHNDWFVTLLAAAGVPNIAEQLRSGAELAGTTYRVHLDGHDQLAYLTGESDASPREHFFYVSDDGDLTALRFNNWKFVFLEQRAVGTLQIWAEPYTELRVPKLFNLRTDPYERADITSNTYFDWLLDHVWLFVPAQAYVANMLATLVEFPPRQKPASFNLDRVLEKLQAGVPSA
jgi:arylsulfatase A-like enzyme